MSNAAKSKLYAFERTLFLKSRTMKTAGALGAVGALAAILDDLSGERIVQTNPVANAAIAKLSADLGGIAAALEVGAQEAALQLYAHLLTAIPTIHALVSQTAPAEIRGSDPTKTDELVDAAQRAIAILNF